MVRTLLMATGAFLTLTTAAWAQTTAAPADQSRPAQLIVEKIQKGWLIAPDVRGADLDGRAGSLAGGYAGRITDRTWVIGGGGYWLTNRDDDFKLAYGGAVVEWLARSDRKIGFGVRSLLGFGSATLLRSLGELVAADPHATGGRTVRFGGGRSSFDPTTRVAVRDDFLIAEPQANLLVNFTRRYRLAVGLGYRLVGSAAAFGDQLNGASGSVSLQFNP